MGFRTKIDYSNSRQINQYIETRTILSGATQFGVLFSSLPTGANPSVSGTSLIGNSLISTFSGNSATTIFTWYDNRMELGHSRLSAITPSNSATTQQTGNVFTGNTSTTIDGNSLFTSYSGINFDIIPYGIVDLGSGNYSGSVNSLNVYLLTASTLDFTGRTIWCDVSGITRTNDLIITKTPSIGYVWTCFSTEGKGQWSALGTGSTNYWSGGSGTNAIIQNYSEGSAGGNNAVSEGFKGSASGNFSHAQNRLTTASGIASHAEGNITIAEGLASHSEGNLTWAFGLGSHAQNTGTTAAGNYSHAGGSGSTASGTSSFVHSVNSIAGGNRSVVIGGKNITGTTDDTVYVPDLVIKKNASVPTTSGDTSGNAGSITWDNNYIYVKTLSGWGRTLLSYAF